MIKKTLLLVLALSVTLPVGAADPAPAKKKGGILGLLKKEDKDPKPSQAEAEEVTKSLTAAQKTKLMDIVNKGDEAALTSLPGIGATRAAAIQKARPIAAPANLVDVDGVGTATLKGLVDHAKAGFPAAAVTEKAAPKKEAAKPAAKAEPTKATPATKPAPATKAAETKPTKTAKGATKAAVEEPAKKKGTK
jgi:hypothetical protein